MEGKEEKQKKAVEVEKGVVVNEVNEKVVVVKAAVEVKSTASKGFLQQTSDIFESQQEE